MEVVLKIHMPDHWIKGIAEKFPAPIKFIECMPYGESGGRGLIKIDTNGHLGDEIIEEIKKHPNVCDVDVTPIGENRIIGSVTLTKCVGCKALTGSNCFLISASSHSDGDVEWKLIVGAQGSLVDLITRLQDLGCHVELKRKTNLNKKTLLTGRQEDVIRMALEMGYYDHPKKVNLKELAQRFSISASTLNEILQRGEKKIIGEYFSGAK